MFARRVIFNRHVQHSPFFIAELYDNLKYSAQKTLLLLTQSKKLCFFIKGVLVFAKIEKISKKAMSL